MRAASKGHAACVSALLQSGAEVNAQNVTESCACPCCPGKPHTMRAFVAATMVKLGAFQFQSECERVYTVYGSLDMNQRNCCKQELM